MTWYKPFLAVLFLYLFSIVYSSPTNQNGFSLASYYSDHVVLQKAPERANLWGHSTKLGDHVKVVVFNKHGSHHAETKVTHGADGKLTWKVMLPPISAGGPYTINVVSSLATLHVQDVLFGDVWICSGQSNMGFTLIMDTDNSTQELNNAHNFPNIRLFTVGRTGNNVALSDLKKIEQHWAVPSRASLGGRPWSHFSSVCWHYGKDIHLNVKYPIGLIVADYGATLIESWSSQDAIAKCGSLFPYTPSHHFYNQPGALWNSMIHPLLPFTIYGVIWYQGESNSPNPEQYKCSFPAMISDWRDKFNKESGGQTSKNFPFGFVQLAPTSQTNNRRTGMTDIRVAQTAGYGYVPNSKMSNVFMAVAVDLPDFHGPFGSIHPRHKDIVAKRLSYGAMTLAYHKSGIHYQGPYPSKIVSNKQHHDVAVHYNNLPITIKSHDGFEICCTNEGKNKGCNVHDKTWHNAKITHWNQNAVIIEYPKECHSSRANAIRYIWRESPCQFMKCAVYGVVNDLPAPPFKQFLEDTQTHIIG